ncbi:hypothetical protein GJAV_G00139650 [Gymnothorax javanicus]|nr:hypothetical protein GJAV_G00139650 [Gymnothorax javanicus]
MGADSSKNNKQLPAPEEERCHTGWRGVLSSMGISVPSGLCRLGARRMILDKGSPLPDDHPFQSIPGPERLRMEWSLPGFISMFLPEFPHRNVPGHEHFQVLGYIAKGSFGPILKVKDQLKQRMYAVKVIPKAEVLRQGVLEQSKEEVIIQGCHQEGVPLRPKAALPDPPCHSPASSVTPITTQDTPCEGTARPAIVICLPR